MCKNQVNYNSQKSASTEWIAYAAVNLHNGEFGIMEMTLLVVVITIWLSRNKSQTLGF